MSIATVLVMKRIHSNFYREKKNKSKDPFLAKFQPARMLRLNNSSIIVMIFEAKTQ